MEKTPPTVKKSGEVVLASKVAGRLTSVLGSKYGGVCASVVPAVASRPRERSLVCIFAFWNVVVEMHERAKEKKGRKKSIGAWKS